MKVLSRLPMAFNALPLAPRAPMSSMADRGPKNFEWASKFAREFSEGGHGSPEVVNICRCFQRRSHLGNFSMCPGACIDPRCLNFHAPRWHSQFQLLNLSANVRVSTCLRSTGKALNTCRIAPNAPNVCGIFQNAPKMETKISFFFWKFRVSYLGNFKRPRWI